MNGADDVSNKGKRWRKVLNRYETRPDVETFLNEIDEVSRRHGMSIGHEDGHGAFIIHKRGDGSGLEYADVGSDLDPPST